jgi:hypothetical protein
LLGGSALWADAPNLIALRIAKADNLTLVAAPFAFGTAEQDHPLILPRQIARWSSPCGHLRSAQIEQRKMVGIVLLGSLPVCIRANTQRRQPHAANHASSAPCINPYPPR